MRRDAVTVTSLGGVAAATRAFTRSGQVHVTAVVKATFSFASGALMLAPPAPIARDEVPLAKGMGLASAGDLAPYLRFADVTLTGHGRGVALDESGEPGGPRGFRLALVREGAALIDKWVELDGAGAGAARIAGMGPIARDWPVRRRLLGGLDPGVLDAEVPDLPSDLTWDYFQAAPGDQRTGHLTGGETLGLEGLDDQPSALMLALPAARGAARLYGAVGALRMGRALSLALDGVQVDTDARTVTLVWRACFPISAEADLGAMRLVAGLERPEAPIAWPDPLSALGAPVASAAPREAPAPAEAGEERQEKQEKQENQENPLQGTVALGAVPASVRSRPVVPFKPGAGPAAPASGGQHAGVPPARASAPGALGIGAPAEEDASPFGGTLVLSGAPVAPAPLPFASASGAKATQGPAGPPPSVRSAGHGPITGPQGSAGEPTKPASLTAQTGAPAPGEAGPKAAKPARLADRFLRAIAGTRGEGEKKG